MPSTSQPNLRGDELMLSPDQLLSWYQRLQITEGARSEIDRIRSSGPSRRVGGGSSNGFPTSRTRRIGLSQHLLPGKSNAGLTPTPGLDSLQVAAGGTVSTQVRDCARKVAFPESDIPPAQGPNSRLGPEGKNGQWLPNSHHLSLR